MKTTGAPLRVRDDLVGVQPYVSPQRPARYRMNTNESPYAPPEGLVARVTAEIEGLALNRYPDRDATRLYDAIAQHNEWSREGLWVANGSNEVFLHLFLAFGGPGRTALIFEPTYSLHALIPKIAGTRVVSLPRGDDFRIDVSSALDAIDEHAPEVVIVCSPNNPTGGVEPLETVAALLERAPGVVVVDEAYIEFADAGRSVRPMLADRPNLVVTRTFSKAWRLAGVRIGYMLAAPEFVAELARVRLPYHLSAITQVVGEAALAHAGETLQIVKSIAVERDRIIDALTALDVKTYESQANFVLFEIAEADEVWAALLDRGVLVRSYTKVPSLENCLRVTAGLPEETDAFAAAMQEVLDERA